MYILNHPDFDRCKIKYKKLDISIHNEYTVAARTSILQRIDSWSGHVKEVLILDKEDKWFERGVKKAMCECILE